MKISHHISLGILLLFTIFLLTVYGPKEIQQNYGLIWLYTYLVLILVFFNLNTIGKIVLCLLVIRVPFLRYSFFLWHGVILTIISGMRFNYYPIVGRYIFGTEIKLIENLKDIPKQPTILLANYPTSVIEYTIQGILVPKVCVVIKAFKWAVEPIYGNDNMIMVGEKGGFQKVQEKIMEKIKNGYHIFAYVDHTPHPRTDYYKVTKLRSGIFKIAHNLDIPITPLAIDHVDHVHGVIQPTYFQINVGKTTKVTNINKSMENTLNFFNEKLHKFRLKRLVK